MGLAAAMESLLALLFTILLARLLGPDEYGSLAALISAFLILAVAGTGLQATVAREIGWRRAGNPERPLASDIPTWPGSLVVAFLALIAISVALRDVIATVIGVDEEWAACITVPMAGLWLFISALRGSLLGVGAYRIAALSLIGEPAGWLCFGVAAVLLGFGVTGAILGIATAELALALVLQAVVRTYRNRTPAASPHGPPLRRLIRRAAVPMAALALFAALQNLDVIAVQHLASEADSSSYAAASIASKAVVWLAIGVGLYLLPEAARRTAEGFDGRPVLARALAVLFAAAAPMIIVYALAGRSLLEVVFGAELAGASNALALLGVAMTLLASTYLMVQYQLALDRKAFLLIVGAAAVIEPAVLSVAGADFVKIAVALISVQLAAASTLLVLVLRARRAL